MRGFLDDLLNEHMRIRSLMRLLKRETGHLERVEPLDFDLIDGSIHYCREYLDGFHHYKEDLILERLRPHRAPSVGELEDLSRQHRELAEMSRDMETVFEQVRDGAVMLREDLVARSHALMSAYETHLAWEDEHFFPVADAVLTDEDWAAVSAQVEETPDPLLRQPPEWRYSALVSELEKGGSAP